MKKSIYKNHYASTVFRTDDAGTNLEGLIDKDDLTGGGITPTNIKTPEQIKAEEDATQLEKDNAAKLIQDIELAKTLGGIKFDETGNLLDVEGKIIKTVQELEKLTAPKAIEIDGIEYQINDKGEAIDKDGKVIKTKDEIDTLIEQDNQIPLIDEIQAKAGYTIKGEDGKPKIYPDTIEGIIDFANDIAIVKSKESQKKFFDMFPEVADYATYLQRGGNSKDYFTKQTSSFLNMKLDESDETQLHNIIVADLVRKGMDKEQADYTAKTYKDTGKLKDFGKAAFTRLQNEEKEAKKNEDQLYQKQQDDEEKRLDNHWNSINEVIKKGTLKNITIPENEREAFFKHIAIAIDKNGRSQEQIDDEKLSIDDDLEIRYLKFKKFNLDTLVRNKTANNQVKLLRDRIKQHTGVAGGKGINNKEYKKPNNNPDNISIDKLY